MSSEIAPGGKIMKNPSINFYTSDFITETMFLSFEEKGKLITLLCLQHQHGRLTLQQMKQICGEISEGIMNFFTKDETGKYYNERLEENQTKKEEFIKKQKENIAKRWNRKNTNSIPNEYQTDTKTIPNSYQNDTKQDSLVIPLGNGNGIGKEIEKEEIKQKRVDREKKKEVSKPKQITPQAKMCDYFAERYKANTGIDYLATKSDYSQLDKLIKQYGEQQVKQKIDWLEIGCTHHNVFWFAKDFTAFTVNKLHKWWNEILPKLTDEQRKEQAKRKKEAENKAKVMAELAKQGIKIAETAQISKEVDHVRV